jgi:hypothetical protein
MVFGKLNATTTVARVVYSIVFSKGPREQTTRATSNWLRLFFKDH